MFSAPIGDLRSLAGTPQVDEDIPKAAMFFHLSPNMTDAIDGTWRDTAAVAEDGLVAAVAV
jgi:hypothetical protein